MNEINKTNYEIYNKLYDIKSHLWIHNKDPYFVMLYEGNTFIIPSTIVYNHFYTKGILFSGDLVKDSLNNILAMAITYGSTIGINYLTNKIVKQYEINKLKKENPIININIETDELEKQLNDYNEKQLILKKY